MSKNKDTKHAAIIKKQEEFPNCGEILLLRYSIEKTIIGKTYCFATIFTILPGT